MTEEYVLAVDSLRHTYGTGEAAYEAVRDISFAVAYNHIVSIVGPSGSGKSTTLKAISGLMKPSGGVIRVNGATIQGVPKALAMVFQDYGRSLYPWMSVYKNVEFPLLGDSDINKSNRRNRVLECLEAVGLSGHEAKYPWQLSGGMQQRVAIARAIAYRPAVMLMDEPFASVDAQTRADLEDLVLRIRDEFSMTIVFVTHDIDESVYLSNSVVVISSPPSTVMEHIEIPLGEQRDQIDTRALPIFIEKRSRIAELIRQTSHQLEKPRVSS